MTAEAPALLELLPTPKLAITLVKDLVHDRIWGSLSRLVKYDVHPGLIPEGMRGFWFRRTKGKVSVAVFARVTIVRLFSYRLGVGSGHEKGNNSR